VLAVEPVTAACVTASLAAGHPVTVETSAPTCMTGLNCGTVSAIAWPVIRRRLDAAIGVTDDETGWARGILRENGVPVGPCGAASAAGVQAALDIPGGVETLGLDGDARVVLLSTEGAGEGKDTAWTR
jgi:diaminopropionate ammonia-lyase